MRLRDLFALAPGLVASAAGAANFSGFIAGEVRFFTDAPQYPEQFNDRQSALILSPEWRWRADNGDRYTLVPRVLFDSQDHERSHADLREAYWLRVGDEWEWLVGINRAFWGVTESRHLVDIVNQTDQAGAFDGEEKLGQPMINLTTRRDWGSLSLFVLPGFRERTFPGEGGRLRPALPVDKDSAVYESAAEVWHTDLALRYSHYVGNWDIGAYYFNGTGREPRLVPNVDGTGLLPHYDMIHQLGIDLQYTWEASLWKFEGILREGQGDTFSAVVAGLEYTFYQIGGDATDLGLLVEYLYDGRNSDATVAPPTPFDDDFFLGARLAFNDAQDTSVLVGVIVDQNNDGRLFSIEAERRLGTNWTVEMEGRWFSNIDATSALVAFSDDSFFGLRLAYHF